INCRQIARPGTLVIGPSLLPCPGEERERQFLASTQSTDIVLLICKMPSCNLRVQSLSFLAQRLALLIWLSIIMWLPKPIGMVGILSIGSMEAFGPFYLQVHFWKILIMILSIRLKKIMIIQCKDKKLLQAQMVGLYLEAGAR